jgi:hypothetical protein
MPPLEPEDISAILEIDRKITGEQRAITYRDLLQEALGGQMDVSFVAEMDDKMVGFVLAYNKLNAHFIETTRPPVILIRSEGESLKIAFGLPAAAHISSYCWRSSSMKISSFSM